MHVVLTSHERKVAHSLAELDAGALGVEVQKGQVDAKCAILAACRVFNMYPNLTGQGIVDAATRTHQMVKVIHVKEKKDVYPILPAWVSKGIGVYIVVDGYDLGYTLRGYATSAMVSTAARGDSAIFDHVLTPIKDEWTFLQVANGTFDFRTAYTLEDGEWKPKHPQK